MRFNKCACRAVGAACVVCTLGLPLHEVSASIRIVAQCITGVIPIDDLNPPECDSQAPHNRTVRVYSLASSTGTATSTSFGAVVSQIAANDETMPEFLDRRFPNTTSGAPSPTTLTSDDYRTPIFIAENGRLRQIK